MTASIALPPRRRLPSPATLLWAFIRRDAALAWSYRVPFFMGFLQSFLALGMLYFLGRLVGSHVSTAPGLVGGYFSFALVGTVMLLVFNATLIAVAQRLRTDQTTGTLEVVFTMPQSPTLSVVGGALFPVVYALAGAFVTVGVAAFLGMHMRVTMTSGIAAAATLAGALCFYGAASIALGAFVLAFKRSDTVTALVTGAVTLLGGVYYPVALLPHALRIAADLLPFTWAVSVMRATLLSGQVPVARLALLWGMAAGAFPLSLWLFNVALRRARLDGSLGQY